MVKFFSSLRFRSPLYFFFLTAIFSSTKLSAQSALEPLQPSQQLSPELHMSPDESSSLLHQILNTDKVTILRSQGEWYEVDVQSPDGLEFHGWVKGGVAKENIPPPLPKAEAKKPELKPIGSKHFHWFWNGELKKKGSLSLSAGYQQVSYLLTGLVDSNGSSTRVRAPSYDFGGVDLGFEGHFSFMETELGHRLFRWLARLKYNYGFLNVTFGSSSLSGKGAVPSELEGAAYRITTQNLQVESLAQYKLLHWHKGDLSAYGGPGLFFFESAPDLRRTPSGDIIFTQVDVTSFMTRLGLEFSFFDHVVLNGSFGILFFPNFNEDPESSGLKEIKSTSLPYLIAGELQYFFNSRLSVLINGEYFKAETSQKGTSVRIGQSYTDLQGDLSYYKVLAGIGIHF